MRVRIRGPAGQSTISLEESATIEHLHSKIKEVTGLTSYNVKYSYPPKPLALDQFDPQAQITEIGTDLNGEQLIISEIETGDVAAVNEPQKEETAGSQPRSSGSQPGALYLNRKQTGAETEPPEIASSEHSGTIVLRIMPDDNSCLFRAVGSAVLGEVDAMTEMRSIVAQEIQKRPDIYDSAVLEKNRDDYCRWIQSENAWGGGIELSILSKHFEIEICSIDVKSLRIDRFNEGQPTRCVLVYSGIHYDTIALSPSDPPFDHAYAPPEFDTKIFDSADPVILEKAVALCQILKQKRYFTDTAGFQVLCRDCGGTFVGEKGAVEHAKETGHSNFGEAS